MSKISNKILYFSGLYPSESNSRGVPFIDNRFELIKEKCLSKKIYYLDQQDTKFVAMLKRILLKQKEIKINCRSDQNERNNWCPIVCKNNVVLLILNYFSRKNKNRYLSWVIKKRIPEITNVKLVHVHWAYPTGYIFSVLKSKIGVKYVLTLHGSDIHGMYQKSDQVLKMTITALDNADKCIFVSEKLKRMAMQHGYSGNNSVVIPNGYNPKSFYFCDKKISKQEIGIKSNKLVGFVGNLIDVKNVLVLPEIFRRIKDKYKDVEFVIIGDGIHKNKLITLADEMNIEIKFTGNIQQKHVADYMRAMDVMLLPSKNEGWPCVIKEAYACGTFVIGSDRGGISEAIGKLGRTYVLNENFIDNCSNCAVGVLYDNYSETPLLKDAANYTWDQVVKMEEEIYEEVLEAEEK